MPQDATEFSSAPGTVGAVDSVARAAAATAQSTADGAVSVNATQVVGPASSVDNVIVRFDGTTGKLVQGGTSAPSYDDSGNLVMVALKTVDGRDVSVDGATLDTAVTNIATNTANILLKADRDPVVNNQTGTTYGFVLADDGKIVTGNNASDQTFTLPANGTIAIPVGACIPVVQLGAGRISFAITSDTLNNPGLTARTRAQYSMVLLTKLTTTMWVISGDMG